MKNLVVFAFFSLVSCGVARANDIYLAQNPVGAANGSSCSAAFAFSFFNSSANWGTGSSQIGPGTTVHLCGTISGAAGSTLLTFEGSGTSSSPITLHFESGAGVTAPYWSTSGAINTNSNSYITIDGGANGYVTASANGTNFANHQDTLGVNVPNCKGCTVKNLQVMNLYVHTGLGTDGGNSFGIHIYGGSGNTVTGNTVHDVRWAIFNTCPGGSTTTAVAITNNTIYSMDHGVTVGDGNTNASLSGAVIAGNTFHDMTPWDNTANLFHHDYIHVFESNGGSTYSGVQIYNNHFYGDPGANINSLIFIEQNTGNTNSGWQVFNNIMTISSTSHLPPYGFINGSGGSNPSIYNNTIIGSSTSQTIANECIYVSGTGYKIQNNSCQNVGLAILMNSGSTLAAVDNNNWYNTGGSGAFYNGSYLTFSAWKSFCSCDAHSNTSNPNLNSTYYPNSGSPLIKAALQLNSLGIAPLNKDYAGQSRPTTYNWDMGALQFPTGTTASAPNAPTDLAATVQ